MSKQSSKEKDQDQRLREQLARALADYDNLEKRVAAQRQEWALLAKLEVIDKLLPVVDDLKRAEVFLKDKGLKLVADQLCSLLRSEGVEEVESEPGTRFDPEKMDCVALVPGVKNTVVTVTQKGYCLGKRIIRPTKVEVGSGGKKGKGK